MKTVFQSLFSEILTKLDMHDNGFHSWITGIFDHNFKMTIKLVLVKENCKNGIYSPITSVAFRERERERSG